MKPILISTCAAALCLASAALAAPHVAAGMHGGAAATGAAVNASATGGATATTSSTTTTQRGPASTGQPNQTCGTQGALETPGQAMAAPGSAFNPNGKAGSVYAGQQTQNSQNTASVAQYDVACSHQR